jgi:N-acetylglucosaminyldiphosphoundecaprenol N-acetyl-beta-D-mannosaminyltransferase
MTTLAARSDLIAGARVHVTSYEHAVKQILAWVNERSARSVYAANVHVVMEAHDNPDMAEAVNCADLVTPDGVPLVWALKILGHKNAQRVYGPDLTLHLCKAAADAEIPIGLYGSSPETIAAFKGFLKRNYPALNVACAISPPYRELSADEDASFVKQIINSGARILFLALGCPRQELWIASHKNRLPLVMLAVGAAFDFHAGKIKQAPRWMMRMGLEWLFRFAVEPGRLWKRYLKHNPRFVWFFAKQVAARFLGLIK